MLSFFNWWGIQYSYIHFIFLNFIPVPLLLLLVFATQSAALPLTMKLARDPNSFANTENYIVDHVHLDLTVDFDAKLLTGQAILTFKVKAASDEIIVDTRNLEIKGVTDRSGTPLTWNFGEPHPALGSALKIKPPSDATDVAVVRIAYSTTTKSEAIQFLTPEQTAGKVHPYVFTQCQAIHARSLLPCQDTPSVKIIYSASGNSFPIFAFIWPMINWLQ